MKHRHRHHRNRPLKDFFANISVDIIVYAMYPLFQGWRSVKAANGHTNSLITFAILDLTVLGLLWFGVIPTIYKRNREEQTDKSRSGIVLAVIAITLIIAIIKDYLIMPK